jgi:6-phosphogluconolactonase
MAADQWAASMTPTGSAQSTQTILGGPRLSPRANGEVRTFADAETLARRAAEWLCDAANAASGKFAICLSGGSTPRRLYQMLSENPIAMRMPWDRIHWFFGDERFVPHDHPDSNFRMAEKALFSRAPIARGNIHPIPTEAMTPEQAAADYEQTLQRYYGAESLDSNRPMFGVMLLGLGEDGHTASLFPGNPALTERRRWVAAVAGGPGHTRITLTYPALNSSALAAFLVAGQSKRDILSRALGGDDSLPALGVRPVGRLFWFVDRAACPQPSDATSADPQR